MIYGLHLIKIDKIRITMEREAKREWRQQKKWKRQRQINRKRVM